MRQGWPDDHPLDSALQGGNVQLEPVLAVGSVERVLQGEQRLPSRQDRCAALQRRTGKWIAGGSASQRRQIIDTNPRRKVSAAAVVVGKSSPRLVDADDQALFVDHGDRVAQ
ncbi:MAG: hypothetical protein V5B31_10435 [Candidatus Accumulibacter propinquus]|uniref:hypothetical protein n=1 Tax=Candidatus Accumulibacter propinquus TaxID=2954380 RepID=UPI002FC2FF95